MLAENFPRPRVDGQAHARRNFLHVNLGGGLDARVPQDLLRVLHRPVPLHVGAQRAAHHLKGHEFFRNAQLLGMGWILHLRKFRPWRGTTSPFRMPRPNVGNMSASGEMFFDTLRSGLDDRYHIFRYRDRVAALPRLEPPFVELRNPNQRDARVDMEVCASSSNHRSVPYASMSSKVWPSTPAAPPLALQRS